MLLIFRQKGSQNICEVEIKEESCSDEQDHHNAENEQTDADDYDNDDGPSSAKRPYSIVNSLSNASTFLSTKQQQPKPNGSSICVNGGDDFPSLSINNVAATLDTLKMIKNGQFGHNNNTTNTNIQLNPAYQNGNNTNYPNECSNKKEDEDYDASLAVKKLLNMHNKEHNLRMEILETQLQTAKYNRDLAEINKMIAIRNLGALSVNLNGQNN